MPSVYSLKARFQRLLRPIARLFASAGITANQVTVATCVLSVAIGTWLAVRADNPRLLLLLPPFFVIRMALNAMDGMLARDFGQKSNLGAYLNELSDVISDAFLYLPFAYLRGFDPLWIGTIIVLAVVSEMAGVIATMTGASRRYDGPMGKSDRALVFGAAALWIGVGGTFPPWASSIFEKAMVVLLIVTVINRTRKGLAETGSARRGARSSPKL